MERLRVQDLGGYYWATVFVTLALGTAVGDYTVTALRLGYLASGIIFGIAILVPALTWWQFRHNATSGSCHQQDLSCLVARRV